MIELIALALEAPEEVVECVLNEDGVPQSPHGCDFDQSICNGDNCVGWTEPEVEPEPTSDPTNIPEVVPVPDPAPSATKTSEPRPEKRLEIGTPHSVSKSKPSVGTVEPSPRTHVKAPQSPAKTTDDQSPREVSAAASGGAVGLLAAILAVIFWVQHLLR